MNKLTAIYWIKNEARYLPEFIEFHLLQGYDHFIFYDNGSTDNLLEVMEPYLEQNLVEIRYYPDGELPVRFGEASHRGAKNFWLMEHCIKEQRHKSRWIHFHAVDERLFCPDGRPVPEALREYEQYGGVGVTWTLFTSNGHVARPEGLITDNFTEAYIDPDKHVKSIIDPIKAEGPAGNPHNFLYNNNHFTVTEDHVLIPNAFADPTKTYDTKFSLYHYATMSKTEFEEKMNKGVLDDKREENSRRSYADTLWPKLNGGLGPLSGRPATLFTNTTLTQFSEPIKRNIRLRFQGREHLLPLFNH